ncbi:aliphatic sulfonate ABC transporter substrate-binding protein [Acinetobacter nectaris]|uniref:aliphatic sulfonate ABC transporter substrate-binding protein n=1 Tax=Acinetobacter nectaris TaxID=1219382 RepID=UPI001F00FE6C|nr:aliphatic sulfonate ABC transporter substrate-binding protein [Acinetobacter nectaris]MCF8999206.1 aliphatic sulfonate ABC transporter substrate-binding protein [Acinetobacter nectaris]MCF9026469.1 aliphatic sulfonate ABC transporter substrate-binding protein [Acinetobacter nectaris]
MKSFLTTTATILTIGLTAFGCQKSDHVQQNQTSATNNEITTLNIGYQKAALKLIVAKQNHFFEKEFPNVKISWNEFPAGPPTLEALSAGAINFGYTGDAPIVFALSAGKSLNYLGYEDAAKRGHALLVPNGSNIHTLSDLKGKRIGLTKGSSAHNFLAEVLRKANLTWTDIQPVWLAPSDARAALDKKAIDAWAVWEPYVSATELSGTAKAVFDSTTLPKTYGYYLAQPSFIQQHPKDAQKVLDVLNETDQWINSHPKETAEILANSTGLNLNIAEKVLTTKPTPNPVEPLTPTVIQSQQDLGNLFFSLKLIPNNIHASEFVWHPQK